MSFGNFYIRKRRSDHGKYEVCGQARGPTDFIGVRDVAKILGLSAGAIYGKYNKKSTVFDPRFPEPVLFLGMIKWHDPDIRAYKKMLEDNK